MNDQEYIEELELRLKHSAEQVLAMQKAMAAILSERQIEREQFDSRETILRDNFASSAMNGLVSSHNYNPFAKDLAKSAYIIADAMMKARLISK